MKKIKKVKIIIFDDKEMVVISGKTSDIYQTSFSKDEMGVAISLNEVKKEIIKRK